MSKKIKYKQKPVMTVPPDERIVGAGGDNSMLNPKSRYIPGVNSPAATAKKATVPGNAKKKANPLNPFL